MSLDEHVPGRRVERHTILPVDEATPRDVAELDQDRADSRARLQAAIDRGDPIIAVYPDLEKGEVAFMTFGSADTLLLVSMLLAANHGSASLLEDLARE